MSDLSVGRAKEPWDIFCRYWSHFCCYFSCCYYVYRGLFLLVSGDDVY